MGEGGGGKCVEAGFGGLGRGLAGGGCVGEGGNTMIIEEVGSGSRRDLGDAVVDVCARLVGLVFGSWGGDEKSRQLLIVVIC